MVIGGSLAVRRSAMAHITFSLVVGVLGILLLSPLVAASEWVGARLDDSDGVVALATFSSLFKLAGIVAFYPWLDGFSRFIVRISGSGSESAVSRLEPALAEAGADVAFEAAWRAVLEMARGAVDAVRRRLAGESAKYDPPAEALARTAHFLESLRLETTDLGTIAPRLVRICHALDHLEELHDDLGRIPAVAGAWQAPAGFEAGARALASWLDATQDPGASPDPALFKSIEAAAEQLAAERRSGRERILEDVALQRTPPATARSGLDALLWADGAFYHAWRLIESLRIAAGR
jgi:phosphate:Na+ symporter